MDLFGEPTRPEVVQGELLGPRDGVGPVLRTAESAARKTVLLLRGAVQRGCASTAQLEQYREALALLRRDESYNEEEMIVRIRLGK